VREQVEATDMTMRSEGTPHITYQLNGEGNPHPSRLPREQEIMGKEVRGRSRGRGEKVVDRG